MLKKIAAIMLVILSLSFYGCPSAAAAIGGLKSYVDNQKGYQFLYPNGWLQVQVSNGPDVVFRDLIEQTENISVVISPISGEQTLADLGTPSEVGYKLSKSAIAPPNSGRQAELITAETYNQGINTHYILEYEVKLPNQQRHNLASVVVSKGKLFTFNASTTESRWQRVKPLFQQVVHSFSVN